MDQHPFTIKYCLDTYGLDHCTYLDADLQFYSNPKVLIDEMGDNSVLITPHNYHPKYDASAIAGIYCVQFLTIKNTTAGLKVLNWWAQACIKWCYARYEDGKMGDQKYLDSWPYMFDGVHICHDVGAGLAPWNLLNYEYTLAPHPEAHTILVDKDPLIFFHFHDLQYLSNDSWYIGGYDVPDFVSKLIYQPYIKTLLGLNTQLQTQYPGIDTLRTINIKAVRDFDLKFKIGSYVMDVKKSSREFITDVLYLNRIKHYKNYIRVK
ncbi:glycosyl transferase [Mucilaginibacter antarcticus]|uniref:glycosyl transferase n=1 Tax=Mucilaginibacter antarcticus TaxID=1855725 RepID=UPI003644202D